MTDTPKPLSYALVIDERRDTILHAFMEAAIHTESGRIVFDLICKQQGITQQEVAEFVKDYSDRVHELGWCKDDTCQLNKTEGV